MPSGLICHADLALYSTTSRDLTNRGVRSCPRPELREASLSLTRCLIIALLFCFNYKTLLCGFGLSGLAGLLRVLQPTTLTPRIETTDSKREVPCARNKRNACLHV